MHFILLYLASLDALVDPIILCKTSRLIHWIALHSLLLNHSCLLSNNSLVDPIQISLKLLRLVIDLLHVFAELIRDFLENLLSESMSILALFKSYKLDDISDCLSLIFVLK